MTKHECAIVTAHTGITMLRGDDLKYLYRYLSEIIGRPVFSHEIPAVCEQFRDRIKADFIALCRNASDDIVCDDESKTALAKMLELIDKQAVLDIAMSYCPDDDGCCSKAGHDLREMLDEIEALPIVHIDDMAFNIQNEIQAEKPSRTVEITFVRHGRWIPTKQKGYYECSACRYEQTSNPAQRFCSYCGARMDGATDVAGHCGAMMDGGTISRERFAEIMGEDETT